MRNIFALSLLAAAAYGQFQIQEIGSKLGVVYAVRTADVNSDGKLDIVAISGTQVIWYESPSWNAHVISDKVAPTDHVSIAAHDINGDGRLDFALAAEWPIGPQNARGTLHWLEQSPGDLWKLHDVAKIPGAHRIRWGDVDGDGVVELVVMPLEGKVHVFYLPGFREEIAATNIERAHNFTFEEMSGEAGQEIVMASKKGLETLMRQWDGRWTRTIIGEGQPGEVMIGRVNRNRFAATVETMHGYRVVIYEEPPAPLNPQGAPPAANFRRPLGTLWNRAHVEPGLAEGHAVGVADFDGDGSDEVVFGWRGQGGGVGLLKRNGAGKWERGVPLDGKEMATEDLTVADLNGDGLPDVVAGGRATQNVRIYWNKPAGAWTRHSFPVPEGSLTAHGIRLNGLAKGKAIIYSAGEKNYLMTRDGKPKQIYSGAAIIHSAVFDVDGDGDEDFIGAKYWPGYVYWLEQPAQPLTQAWSVHVIEDFKQGGINGVHGLYAHDIDRDGRMDLIANSGQPHAPFGNSLAWFKASAKGTKWERHVFADHDAAGLSHYHGAGDLNGDGRPDIVSAAKIGHDGNWFAWWEQPVRAGPWKKHVLSTEEPGATNALIADLNGDGKNDIIASRGHGFGLLWFEGPRFTKHEIDSTIGGPHSLAIGDIDGDGDIDAVTCAKDSMVVAWFENDGKGKFTRRHIHENQAAYDIRLDDLDGDGDLDVLVAGQESKNVVWFENRRN